MMLGAAPSDFVPGPLREWAGACSYVALDIHRQFDFPGGGSPEDVGELLRRCREGEPTEAGPLVMGELLRQVRILEILAETTGTVGSGAGLRQVRDLSDDGRRVLRAVMSRRARGRS